jgi:peptide/nickel transport system ATP-binding protein
MYLGLVMERGSTQQIFDNPLHPYTIALWRSIPRISGKLERLQPIRGTLPNPYVSPSGCPFFERCQRCKGGVCDAELPPLQEVEPGHLVRCFGCT